MVPFATDFVIGLFPGVAFLRWLFPFALFPFPIIISLIPVPGAIDPDVLARRFCRFGFCLCHRRCAFNIDRTGPAHMVVMHCTVAAAHQA